MPRRDTGRITVKQVEALKPGKSLNESLGRGAGSLQVRATSRGLSFFFRYGDSQTRIKLASFDAQGKPFSLASQRLQAQAMSSRYQSLKAQGQDLKSVLEAEYAQAERIALNKKGAPDDWVPTLEALMTEYANWLEYGDKKDFRDVKNLTKNHIIKPFPQIARRNLSEVTLDDLLQIIERLILRKKLRTASKCRSYIHAAYAAAIRSRFSPQASNLRRFSVTTNIATSISTIENSSQPRDRVLSEEEFLNLWRFIGQLDNPLRAALRFLILTGGQRLAQLRRAKVDDIQEDSLVLWDSKGRRSKPRRHVVPLLPEAKVAILEMSTVRAGPFLLTLTHGLTPADTGTIRRHVKEISDELCTEEMISSPFSLSDIRRTIETYLASQGIPTETRAHLQSHGLGGVQTKHYNRYEYFEEKREALNLVWELLNP